MKIPSINIKAIDMQPNKNESNNFFQVDAFFNAVLQRKELLEVLEDFSQGNSRSYNQVYCADPTPGEIADGIVFGMMGQEIVLTNKEFLTHLNKICSQYLAGIPSHEHAEIETKINELLKKVQQRFFFE